MDRAEVLKLDVVKKGITLSTINVYEVEEGYDYITVNLCEDKPRVKFSHEYDKQYMTDVIMDYLHWWDDNDVEFLVDDKKNTLNKDYIQLVYDYVQ